MGALTVGTDEPETLGADVPRKEHGGAAVAGSPASGSLTCQELLRIIGSPTARPPKNDRKGVFSGFSDLEEVFSSPTGPLVGIGGARPLSASKVRGLAPENRHSLTADIAWSSLPSCQAEAWYSSGGSHRSARPTSALPNTSPNSRYCSSRSAAPTPTAATRDVVPLASCPAQLGTEVSTAPSTWAAAPDVRQRSASCSQAQAQAQNGHLSQLKSTLQRSIPVSRPPSATASKEPTAGSAGQGDGEEATAPTALERASRVRQSLEMAPPLAILTQFESEGGETIGPLEASHQDQRNSCADEVGGGDDRASMTEGSSTATSRSDTNVRPYKDAPAAPAVIWRSTFCSHRGAPPETARERQSIVPEIPLPDAPKPALRSMKSRGPRSARLKNTPCCKAAALRRQHALCEGPDMDGEATQAWIKTLRKTGENLTNCMCYECFMRAWEDLGAAALKDLGLGPLEDAIQVGGDAPNKAMLKQSLKASGHEFAEQRRKALANAASTSKGQGPDGKAPNPEVPSTPVGDVVRVLTNELRGPRDAASPPTSPSASPIVGVAEMRERQLRVRTRPESAASSRNASKGSRPASQTHRMMSTETSKRPKQDWKSIQTRRGADILTAMHERHVQLEAHMRLTSRNTEEELTLTSNRGNSIRQRSTILRSSQLLKDGKESAATARLTILSARDLLPGRRRGGGTADVYCVCFAQKARQQSQQTKVIPQTLDPVWEEVLFLSHFPPDEPVVFHIMDELDEELLGQGTLLPSQYHGGFSGQVDLFRPGLRGRPAEPAGHLELQMKVLYSNS